MVALMVVLFGVEKSEAGLSGNYLRDVEEEGRGVKG